MKKNTVKIIITTLVIAAILSGIVAINTFSVSAATYDANKVVNYANSKVGTTFANGYCLKFVRLCFENTYGFSSSACCARKYAATYIDSTSSSNIPLGSDVFFSGSSTTCSTCGNKCGHVGIYVGNGYIVHGWGGKIVKTTISYVTSRGYSYLGYGWHGNVALSSSSTSVSYPVLRQDSKGNEVKALQNLLNYHGASLAIDGSFGPATLSAVKSFQSKKSISVDGVVGPETWSKLIVTLKEGSKGKAVSALQLLLKSKFSYSIAIDGSFGPATLSAVKSFQSKKSISVDGVVGPTTWKYLLDK